MSKEYKTVLEKYLPSVVVDSVYSMLQENKVHLRISRGRKTKYGDYRPAINGNPHRISVNHDLNQYAFLITLIHEIAHLKTWNKFQRRAKPHGKEWQSEFKDLLIPIIEQNVFPERLAGKLTEYISKPKATTIADTTLTRLIMEHQDSIGIFLEDVEEGTLFKASNGRLFRKGQKLRKRFKCVDMENHKHYLFSPVAQVEPMK